MITMNDTSPRLPAEWEEQGYIQLTWPHEETDWKDMLNEVEECYYNIAREIAKRQPLIVVSPRFPSGLYDSGDHKGIPHISGDHKGSPYITGDHKGGPYITGDREGSPYGNNIYHVQCDTNDTWARDHAFITAVSPNGIPQLMDFQFNGWGLKFPANKDNKINFYVHESGLLRGDYVDCRDFVLEGGSIESDGKGTILTTSSCLLSDNRNDTLSKDEIEERLMVYFGAKQVLWLEHSFLAGDDTDGHIDTVARLCPGDTILYTECTDLRDEHYVTMRKMALELSKFRTSGGKGFKLIPLPMPKPIYDASGQRLPATYTNFLIMNEAVLCPTYGQPETDHIAMERIGEAFPGREIVGIDCRALIRQHGSLHCATMQFPKQCLKNK